MIAVNDEFTLALAVGIKDLYSEAVSKIEARTESFRKKAEYLQQVLADAKAFKKISSEIDSLSEREKALSEEAQVLARSKEKLLREISILSKGLKEEGGASAETEQKLQSLKQELAKVTHREAKLSQELREVSQKKEKAAREAAILAGKLKQAGVSTEDLTKDIARLEEELSELNKEFEKTEEKAGVFDKFKEVVAGGAIAATAGGLASTLIHGAEKLNSAIKKYAAATEATVEEAEHLKSDIVEIHARTGRSFEEITEALKLVRQQMGLTGKEAAKAAEKFMLLQTVHPELDIRDIVKAASQMKIAFGTTAEETSDLIATVLEKAGDKAGDLLDTFHEYAPLMREAGLSAKEFTAVLIAGAKAGAFNFDKLADTIKESFKARLSDIDVWNQLVGKGDKKGLVDELLGSRPEYAKAVKDALGELRQGLLTGQDELKKEGYAKLLTTLAKLYQQDAQAARNVMEQIFGTMGTEDLSAKVLSAMAQGLTQADKILGEWRGRTEEQFKESLTFTESLSQAFRELKGALLLGTYEIGKDLRPLGDAVLKLAKGIAQLAKEHPAVAKFLVVLAGLAGAAGAAFTALSLIGFLSQGLGAGLVTAGKAISFLSGGLSAAGRAALFLGRGLMSLAISNPWLIALGIGAVLLWKNWDKVKQVLGHIWDLAKRGLRFVIDHHPLAYLFRLGKGIVHFFKHVDLTEAGKRLLETLANGIKSAVAAPFKAVKSALAKIRRLLPFSPAKEGPLADLDKSGKKLLETVAQGVDEKPLKSRLIKALSLPVFPINAFVRFLAGKVPGKVYGEGVKEKVKAIYTEKSKEIKEKRFEEREKSLFERVIERKSEREPGGRLSIGAINFSPQIHVKVGTAAESTSPNNISETVIQALKERSTEFLLELEAALEELFSRKEHLKAMS